MAQFLSTFVFILPGIMAYFWLQVFGLNPSVKHTAPELSGIAALLWLPVSFITLLVLNTWGALITIDFLSVDKVWTVEALNTATSDIKYLVLFLIMSFIVSYFVCWTWSIWGNEFLRNRINFVRKTRGIAPLSSSSSVWEEFFIKINSESENNNKVDHFDKEAVLIVYKIDKPEEFVAGAMTKASRPLEVDKALVLEDTQQWMDSMKNHYDYDVKRVYVDIKSGMVVKEIDHRSPKDKTIPEDN
ncbi:hypothetical protein DZB84_16975 [Bacillus sp. HNG]|uniref:hypothetical protein n=1 Tax=Bacillus sp. HNG TaxID=2293325 RepID=UPI000E2F0DF4|nr:hypothetical protein [Bacillus sp. HNG]RFB13652.1 hypothetical protein DZB84_16975 [Bacillus sp. HNG]